MANTLVRSCLGDERTGIRWVTHLLSVFDRRRCVRLTPVVPCLACYLLNFGTVFGKVTSGLDVIDKIESVGSQSGATKTSVIIKDCGEL